MSVDVVSVVWIWLKRASSVVFEYIEIEIVELEDSEPFHPENSYPSFGVAIILTEAPSS